MEDGFWGVVGMASVVATALATAVASITAIWWRRQDRREADWALYDVRAERHGADTHGNRARLGMSLMIANAGDGAAFRVRVEGRGCEVSLRGPTKYTAVSSSARFYTMLPVMEPGAEVHMDIEVPTPEGWDDAELDVVWIRSPTWKKRRSGRRATYRVRDLAPLPDPYVGIDPMTGEPMKG